MKSIGSIPIVYKEAAKPRSEADDNYDEFCFYYSHEPEIYEMFEKLTLEMINSGRTRYSATLTLGRMKWDIDKREHECSFVVPTTIQPYFPRKFMAEHPEHLGFYETKTLTSANRPSKKGKEKYDKQTTFEQEASYDEAELREKLKNIKIFAPSPSELNE